MHREQVYDFQSQDWNKTLRVVLVAALLLPLLALRPMPTVTPRAQPALLELAAARPDEVVSVIVQKAAKDAAVEEWVARRGGQVTRDLHIINAIAAVLPAQAVVELAREPSVRWVSLDAPMLETACKPPCTTTTKTKTSTTSASGTVAAIAGNVYPTAINATRVWTTTSGMLQGQGIAVAVIDTGIAASHPDFLDSQGQSRVVASVYLNSATNNADDAYGHGTHVAGLIGGNGRASGGAFTGVAPQVNLVNVKVSDDMGRVTASDVVNGMQWVLDHASQYNIRVVNLSVNSSLNQSYNMDPLDAAAEILWFNKIVVVTAAGNLGKHALYPPANDPFVIAVGAMDDLGTPTVGDDVLAGFSAYGKTSDGLAKPDVAAPGVNLISTLASPDAVLAKSHADHVVNDQVGSPRYFRMSGTSTAAPVVAGAAALILQQNPDLTPDQVKYRLMTTTRPEVKPGMGAGYVNVYAAVAGTSTASANTGTPASRLLWTGPTPLTWTSANWGSANWGGDFWDN